MARLLEVARALRQDADTTRAAALCLGVLAASPPPLADDVAALAQRFARHRRPPPQAFFSDVALHLERSLRSGAAESTLSGTGVAVLADAFAEAHCGGESVNTALGLACLSTPPTTVVGSQELLRLTRACLLLGGSLDTHAIRSFLLMRLQVTAPNMEACDLAEAARVLAQAGLYSPDLSRAVDLMLSGSPWNFQPPDLLKLLQHFKRWKLGPLQRKAFQTLGNRISENAELLSAPDALEVVNVFAEVGSAHEVLLQHLHLRLLLDRSFVQLTPEGIAELTFSMAKVQHYHTGLLREIGAEMGESPALVAAWSPGHLHGVLRCFALAPVRLPDMTLNMLGCRYSTLLRVGDVQPAGLSDFFEVAAQYPNLLQVVLARDAGRALQRVFHESARHWSPRTCADALLAIALALDASPGSDPERSGCACMAGRAAAPQEPGGFRTQQPAYQLRVALRHSRNYKQRATKRIHFRRLVARADVPDNARTKSSLPNLWFAEGTVADAAIAPGNGRCSAPWAQLGRRRRQNLVRSRSTSTAQKLLAGVLQQLLQGFQRGGESLAELPGLAPAAAELLLEESSALDSLLFLPGTLAGTQAKKPALLPEPHGQIGGSSLPMDSEKVHTEEFGAKRGGAEEENSSTGPSSDPPTEHEVMRRSELIEIAVQTLAALQVCIAPRAAAPLLSALPFESCRLLARLSPLVRHVLRPRREEDETAQRYHLGPQRMEAFARRPDEAMVLEVYKSLHGVMPFLPSTLGWNVWPSRKLDRLHGEETGGAHISIRREVEMPPFVICIVMRQKRPVSEQEWGSGLDF